MFAGNNTVNSLMFTGINVCIFETKSCLLVLVFAVISGVVVYLYVNYVYGYLFLRFKHVLRWSANKYLANIN